MAPETYPLLRRFREGKFENCVILTYNADLAFYEQVLLATLRSRGCCNNLVLMDLTQYAVSLECSHELLQGVGRLYSIWPVFAPSAFHPKIILLCGENYGRLVIGSGNLTVRGMSSNWEVFSETEWTEQGQNDGLFRQVWSFIQSLAKDAPSTITNQIRQVNETCPWLSEALAESTWPKLLIGRPGELSITQQLAKAIGSRSVRRLIVVSPFFDRQLLGLKELTKALSPKDVALVVQPGKVSLPGALLAGVKQASPFCFQTDSGAKSSAAYLHAKIYLIETADAEFCMWGSPNCSRGAFAPSPVSGNMEVALLGKAKKGYFLSLLHLADSLTQNSIDPSTLTWRDDQTASATSSFQIVSAEVIGEQIEVKLSGFNVSRKDTTGHLVLTTGATTLPDIHVTRTDERTFQGKWKSISSGSRTIVCRLILASEKNRVESAPAAVHVASVLARETPSRSARNIRELLRNIEARSDEWAQGLEGVYEVFFKLETHAVGAAAKGTTAPKSKSKAKQGEQGEVRAFEHFVSDAKSEAGCTGSSGFQSGLLFDFVRMLSVRLLHGIEGNELENTADTDSWKYREELEKDTADTGEKTQQLSDDERVRLHRLVRRGYTKLMTALTKRLEAMRDDQITVTSDEALRVYLVTTLCIEATARVVEEVRTCGPILLPEDLAEDLLPAIAIFLGRVRYVQKSAGPLFAKVSVDPANEQLRDTAMSVCILLSGLLVYRRGRSKRNFLGQGEEAARWDQFCIEITSARSFATLQQKGLLPSDEQFSAAISRERDRSPWLYSLAIPDFSAAFAELCGKAGAILRIEADPPKVGLGMPASDVHEGDWVYSPIAGVTEVIRISGKNVTLKMIGGHYDDGLLETKVVKTHVRLAGISRFRQTR